LDRANPRAPAQGHERKQHRAGRSGGPESTRLAPAVALGVALFLASSLVLWGTLQPSLGDSGDSAKFQLVARVLGVPHATGYPLYTLLARLFTLLPLRDVAFRVNLFSAVSAAAAVAFLGAAIWVLTRHPVAAGGAALLFAWSETFWSQAVIAEVYALNAAFAALTFLLLFAWRERGGLGLLAAALVVYALSLGNHGSAVLFFPALVWIVAVTDRRALTGPRGLSVVVATLLLIVVQYLWLTLRARQHPPFCEHCPDTLPGLWRTVTGAQFGSQFFAFSPGEWARRVAGSGGLLLAEYGPLPVALGLLGIVLQGVSRWRELVLLALAFAATVLFTMSYDIVDFVNFLIPAYLVFAIWIGSGLAGLLEWVSARLRRSRPLWRRSAALAGTLFIAGLALWALCANRAVVDESSDRAAMEEATALLNLLPEDAVLVLPPCCDFYSRSMAVLYLQQVEGLRSDVSLLSFDERDPGVASRPEFLPRGEESLVLLPEGAANPRAAYLPRVGVPTRELLERHFVLLPVDSSAVSLHDVLNGLPRGSVVILASRQPILFPVDGEVAAGEVEAAMRGCGFQDVHWPGLGAHVLVGVRGAPPGTAVDVWNLPSVRFRLRAAQPIGDTGVTAPVSLRVLSSDADADVIVDGRNVSPHHWGYNLVVLEPESGAVVLQAHFDTETFLVDNVRLFRIVAVRDGAGAPPGDAAPCRLASARCQGAW
jgi:4-amino-4-deoxy-L-arabinose transferase-like glycosyltransferase